MSKLEQVLKDQVEHFQECARVAEDRVEELEKSKNRSIEISNAYDDIFCRQLSQHVGHCKQYDCELNIDFVSGLFTQFSKERTKIYNKYKQQEK